MENISSDSKGTDNVNPFDHLPSSSRRLEEIEGIALLNINENKVAFFEDGEQLEKYDKLESTMADVTHDIDGSLLLHSGGVKKRMLKRGMGECVKQGDLVWVHYKLYVEDRNEPIDETIITDGPKRFMVGNGDVIRGLDIALIGMNEGQEDLCVVKPYYAFGSLGCPPRVPKEARILMYVRLVRIHVSSEIAVDDLPFEERKDKGFNALYDAAERKKIIGNDELAKGETEEAIKKYLRAQELASELIPSSDIEIDKKNVLIFQIQQNLAKVYIDTKKFRRAIEHCKYALAAPLPEPRKLKAYYRLATALFESGEIEESLSAIETANDLGFDPSIKQLYSKIKKEIVKRENVERETAKRMFQNMKLN